MSNRNSNVITLPGIQERRRPVPETIGEWVARELRAANDLVDAVDIPDELRGDALVNIIRTIHQLAREARGLKS